MTLWVKICGVRRIEDAHAVVEANADLAGLNFVPSSRRRIDLELARAIIPELGDIPAVGVFADQPIEEVRSIAETLRLEFVQLHGAEPSEYCATLGETYRVIKALSIDTHFDPAGCVSCEVQADMVLFDATRPGSGVVFDWAKLRGLRAGMKFMLAGGLTPENVREAIEAVRPSGVDTASGVEVNGVINRARVLAFCQRARGRSP